MFGDIESLFKSFNTLNVPLISNAGITLGFEFMQITSGYCNEGNTSTTSYYGIDKFDTSNTKDYLKIPFTYSDPANAIRDLENQSFLITHSLMGLTSIGGMPAAGARAGFGSGANTGRGALPRNTIPKNPLAGLPQPAHFPNAALDHGVNPIHTRKVATGAAANSKVGVGGRAQFEVGNNVRPQSKWAGTLREYATNRVGETGRLIKTGPPTPHPVPPLPEPVTPVPGPDALPPPPYEPHPPSGPKPRPPPPEYKVPGPPPDPKVPKPKLGKSNSSPSGFGRLKPGGARGTTTIPKAKVPTPKPPVPPPADLPIPKPPSSIWKVLGVVAAIFDVAMTIYGAVEAVKEVNSQPPLRQTC